MCVILAPSCNKNCCLFSSPFSGVLSRPPCFFLQAFSFSALSIYPANLFSFFPCWSKQHFLRITEPLFLQMDSERCKNMRNNPSSFCRILPFFLVSRRRVSSSITWWCISSFFFLRGLRHHRLVVLPSSGDRRTRVKTKIRAMKINIIFLCLLVISFSSFFFFFWGNKKGGLSRLSRHQQLTLYNPPSF